MGVNAKRETAQQTNAGVLETKENVVDKHADVSQF